MIDATRGMTEPEAKGSGSSERIRKVISVVGNSVGSVALLLAAAVVGAILWFTNQNIAIGDVFEEDRAGTTTVSIPFLVLLLSLIGFFLGQFATRGRWGVGENTSVFSSGTFRVVLRPISVPLHAAFLSLAILAWALILLLPVLLDSSESLGASEGSTAARHFWLTVVFYGLVSGAIVAVIGVSLVKKLTYNGRLERGRDSVVEGSSSQVAWRLFSHIWRGELMIAALAGGALGLAPLGFHLDSAAYGLSFAAAGIVLLVISVILALNSWRSGLPVERVESYT